MAENNYFNELSISYAKKNKLDLKTARLEVSKIIRNNFNNPYQDKDLLDFDKSLFYVKDLDLVLDLRKKEKKKKNKKHFFSESGNTLF
jgi:hypothetical protein